MPLVFTTPLASKPIYIMDSASLAFTPLVEPSLALTSPVEASPVVQTSLVDKSPADTPPVETSAVEKNPTDSTDKTAIATAITNDVITENNKAATTVTKTLPAASDIIVVVDEPVTVTSPSSAVIIAIANEPESKGKTVVDVTELKPTPELESKGEAISVDSKVRETVTELKSKPVEPQESEAKPDEPKPVEPHESDSKPAETNPVESKPVEANPVDIIVIAIADSHAVNEVDSKSCSKVDGIASNPAAVQDKKDLPIEPISTGNIVPTPANNPAEIILPEPILPKVAVIEPTAVTATKEPKPAEHDVLTDSKSDKIDSQPVESKLLDAVEPKVSDKVEKVLDAFEPKVSDKVEKVLDPIESKPDVKVVEMQLKPEVDEKTSNLNKDMAKVITNNDSNARGRFLKRTSVRGGGLAGALSRRVLNRPDHAVSSTTGNLAKPIPPPPPPPTPPPPTSSAPTPGSVGNLLAAAPPPPLPPKSDEAKQPITHVATATPVATVTTVTSPVGVPTPAPALAIDPVPNVRGAVVLPLTKASRKFANHVKIVKSSTASATTTSSPMPTYMGVLVHDVHASSLGFDRALFWNLPQCYHDPIRTPETINILQHGILTVRLGADYEWTLHLNQELAAQSIGPGRFSGVVDLPVSPGDAIRIQRVNSSAVTTSSVACLVLEFVSAPQQPLPVTTQPPSRPQLFDRTVQTSGSRAIPSMPSSTVSAVSTVKQPKA